MFIGSYDQFAAPHNGLFSWKHSSGVNDWGEVCVSNYYVGTLPQERGEHVVHAEGCPQLERMPFRVNLGEYETCDDAVQKARILFPQVVGCERCSAACQHGDERSDDAKSSGMS